MNLAEKKCIPCRGGVPALTSIEAEKMLNEISHEWSLTHNGARLLRKLELRDFAESLELANRIGEMAEEQWHHPELTIGFGHLDIEIWTHKINALVESDFIFAAKTDKLIDDFKKG